MDNKFVFGRTIDKQNYLINGEHSFTEADFYFTTDDRTWKSNVEDIKDGDNFADYCEYIFDLLEEEGYYD